jgi:hypothetical protein
MDINDARWAAVENPPTGHRLEVIATGTEAKVFIERQQQIV